jgi:hypothetical protein
MMPAIDEFASSIKYNFQQLEALWEQAGGSPTAAPIAAAIALAESGGNPSAPGDGGTSIGLWQVHMPDHPQYSEAQLLDPLGNARAAVQISNGGTDWMPWTSYWSRDGGKTNAGAGNGSFLQYLGGSIQNAAGALLGGNTGSSSGSSSSTAQPVNFTPAVLTGVAIVAVLAAIVGILI